MEAITTISVGRREFKVTESAYMLLSDFDRFLFLNVHDAERKSIIEQSVSDYLDLNLAPGTDIVVYTLALDAVLEVSKRESLAFDPASGGKPKRRLYRNPEDGVLGGVCAGFGDYFDMDPVILRVAFVILAFFSPAIIVYIILWIVLPPRPLAFVNNRYRSFR